MQREQLFTRPASSHVAGDAGFRVRAHAHHQRLYHIELDEHVLADFFESHRQMSSQHLEYVPTARFVLAKALDERLGAGFRQTLRAILHERDNGGFTIGVQGVTSDPEDYVKFGTAIGHLIGPANHDAMSGTFYARFVVKSTDASDSYLRQAYRLFTLHTDGTFVDEATDWLLMMKFSEHHARGGESRLLHLDDWADLKRFSEHPLGAYPFTYRSPASKNVAQCVARPTFFKVNDRECICYIDQFVCPESIEHAAWLQALSDSMEASAGTAALPLPMGDLIVLNNQFWLHGRAPFERDAQLQRELMRQRGRFSSQ
ncbi:glutarate dioxygenase GlaH [Paraburkholderia tagetis]|uniref:Carbon starvation induced protein CsiD n=1 Tax=Paraburkholderia tagetis TaxID=2913261 RepID=A0A9X1RS26_9BURK|nr:glutarate dioxygenase GlaH [Paraburkholderia tagetis]MCG5076288.1 carbon starvation induced protein CsiD [Paraburkholderia tagetis]